MDEAIFEFPAKNRGNPQRAEVLHIHGCIEPVATEMRPRVQLTQSRNQLRGQPRRCVHWQVDRNQSSIGNGRFVQGLSREVHRNYVMTALPQPRRWRRQAEGLPAQFVGRNENDVHAPTSIAAPHLDSFSVIMGGCVP